MNQSSNITYQQVVETMNLRTALGRMVKPGEVAALAVFLASDQSNGIAGQTINCCGGFEMD
jgi:enoyl-[acyl-carrier-protein] reductase (NADH)